MEDYKESLLITPLLQSTKGLITNSLNDVPIVNIENIYPDQYCELNLKKLTSCIWSSDLENNQGFYTIRENNDIEISSIDGHAQLILHSNRFTFQVQYKQLVPVKKPKFVEDPQFEQDDFENLKDKQQFDFTKDFLKKYQIPESKYQINKKKGQVKMHYRYYKMKKIFNIFDFPKRWSVPLCLAWQIFQKQEINKQVKMTPNFPMDLLELVNSSNAKAFTDKSFQQQINQSKIDNNITVQSLSITEVNPDFIQGNKNIEENNHIYQEKYCAFKIQNRNEIMIELPSICIQDYISENQNDMNSNNIWNFDTSAPSLAHPKYEDIVDFVWADNMIGWFTQNINSNNDNINQQQVIEILSLNLIEDKFIFSSQRGQFLNELGKNLIFDQSANNENDIQNQNNERMYFNISEMPQDAIREEQKEFLEILMCLQNIRKYNEEFSQNNQILQIDKNQKQFVEENIGLLSDNFDILKKVENDDGFFEAYKNGFVKARFHDRTICKMSKGSNFVEILSRFGEECRVNLEDPREYEYHVSKTYEFFDYIFSDPKERLAKIQEQELMEEKIQREIQKNERFLTILSNKVPQQFLDQQKKDQQQKENIQQLQNQYNIQKQSQSELLSEIKPIQQHMSHHIQQQMQKQVEYNDLQEEHENSFPQFAHNHSFSSGYTQMLNQIDIDNQSDAYSHAQQQQFQPDIQKILEKNEKILKEINNIL